MKTTIIEANNPSHFTLDDRIFLGEGLFETIKVSHSIPCSSYLHWERMSHSAKELNIPFDVGFEQWQEHITALITKDQLVNGGLKIILSGGPAKRGLDAKANENRLCSFTFTYQAHKKPLHLIRSSWLRDAANPIYRVKSINYLEAILARRDALENNADDVLFFNGQKHVTETTDANLFIIINNQLFTPALHSGVLPGVTRLRIIRYCQQKGMTCAEQEIDQTFLQQAEVMFLTNSLQGIRYVQTLNDIHYKVQHDLVEELVRFL